MKKLLTFLVAFTALMTGCNKTTNNDLIPDTGRDSSTRNQQKVAINANVVEYRISPAYANNYVHWCQLWSSPLSSYERANACGPTAYMIAAHMIAAAHGYSFMPVSGNKLKAIIGKMGGVPISMGQISSHVARCDSPPLTTVSFTTTSKEKFKSFLESHLANGDPIVVPVRVSGGARTNDGRYTSENSWNNYDLSIVDQTTRPNYINSSGFGHFVVLIGVKISLSSCDAYAYYKDPLAQSGETRVCHYERFLASAAANGASNLYYDAIVIRKQ